MADSSAEYRFEENVIRWVFEAGEAALRDAVCGLPIALPAHFSFLAHNQKFEATLRLRDDTHCVLTLLASLPALPFTQEAPEERAKLLATLEALGGTRSAHTSIKPGGQPLLRWDVRMPNPCDLGQLTTVVVICVLGALPVLKYTAAHKAA
jgi:hypothetical protein